MSIPNEDSVRSAYDRMLSRLHVPADPMRCKFCGEQEGVDEDSGSCDWCWTKCSLCGDQMQNEPEQAYKGQRCHRLCAGDAITTEVDAIVSMLPSRKEVA